MIARNRIVLHLVVYFHFHNTEKFIRIQLVNHSKNALIRKLRFDVNDVKEVLRDWDFPFIHLTDNSHSGCLEASVKMVYCAAFDCNTNSSKNRVTRNWFKFSTEPTLFLKSKLQADEAQTALLASKNVVSTAIRTRKDGSPGLSSC